MVCTHSLRPAQTPHHPSGATEAAPSPQPTTHQRTGWNTQGLLSRTCNLQKTFLLVLSGSPSCGRNGYKIWSSSTQWPCWSYEKDIVNKAWHTQG